MIANDSGSVVYGPKFIVPRQTMYIVVRESARQAASMKITASKLRENIYKVLDQILETGAPVEIERRGRTLRILAADRAARGKLDVLEPHVGAIVGNPDDLVHLDWSAEWKP